MIELYPYQEQGAQFLRERRFAYLADGMGLGKTAQAIRGACDTGFTHFIVVAPASLIPNWRTEIQRFRARPTAQFHLMSYASLKNYQATQNPSSTPLVIFDEAHYIKNPESLRTQAALIMIEEYGSAWFLSGTPMPNDPSELWIPAKVAGLTEMSYHRWRTRYCRIQKYSITVNTRWGPRQRQVERVNGVRHKKELKEMFLEGEQFMLRRTLDNIRLQLPPLRVETTSLPMSGTHRSDEIDRWTDTLDQDWTRAMKMIGLEKILPIVQMVEAEFRDQNRRHLVIMAKHLEVIDKVEHALKMRSVTPYKITGRIPVEKRTKIIDQWRQEPGVLIVQQDAGGTGLNLQQANEIILMEPGWSPDLNLQAIKRIHRIGQKEPCRARMFFMPGTRDRNVIEALANKMEMQKEVGIA
ncbi:DEAD/DEAH box helicase [Candidatus Poriferisocius sp.]|uniref:DEAD/DEAH box helicase n=1 Tax=Candidatus Poriferisocius sp. TaxID=3101276 RepID=UPI003B517EF3